MPPAAGAALPLQLPQALLPQAPTASLPQLDTAAASITMPACGNGDRPELKSAAEAANLRWRCEAVPGTTDQYYISSVGRAVCKSYLSVQGCGGSAGIDLWGAAGSNQAFVLVPTGRPSEHYLRAVGRAA
jgi:hypothetical protein